MSEPGEYPRWMFHRHQPMVLVENEEEEAALGADWTRTYPPPEEPEPAEAEPERRKPKKHV